MAILPFSSFASTPSDPAPDVIPYPLAVVTQSPHAKTERQQFRRRSHRRRRAGDGAPEASSPAYASVDDAIRATLTSPGGVALLFLPDGSSRWVEGLRLPDPMQGQTPSDPHPLQAVLEEYPEIAQPGSSANHRFYRAYKKAGSNPAHALGIARTLFQR